VRVSVSLVVGGIMPGRPDGPRDPVVGPDGGPEPPFPLRLDGKVIKGFGRGSSEVSACSPLLPPSVLLSQAWWSEAWGWKAVC